MWTAFYSFFAAYHNMQVDAFQEFGRSGPSVEASMKLAWKELWLVVIPALAGGWALDGGPDDEEEWWAWAAKAVGGYAFSGMVGIRDLANGLFSDFGYGPPPVFKVAELPVRLYEQAAQGELDKALAKAAVMTGAYLLKLPGRQPMRTGEYLYEFMEGNTDGFDPWDAVVTGYRR